MPHVYPRSLALAHVTFPLVKVCGCVISMHSFALSFTVKTMGWLAQGKELWVHRIRSYDYVCTKIHFFNGKFGSLTNHWSIIVPPAEPPDHIHLH
ncbi:hypothetical protein Hanom_Chr10g00930601 [Helianthus anomalus]